jgi:hypothetical protein
MPGEGTHTSRGDVVPQDGTAIMPTPRIVPNKRELDILYSVREALRERDEERWSYSEVLHVALYRGLIDLARELRVHNGTD